MTVFISQSLLILIHLIYFKCYISVMNIIFGSHYIIRSSMLWYFVYVLSCARGEAGQYTKLCRTIVLKPVPTAKFK